MSADKRISFDIVDPVSQNEDKSVSSSVIIRRKTISDSERKVFKIGRWGVAYYGDTRNVPGSAVLERVAAASDENISILELIEKLKEQVSTSMGAGVKINFVICGYCEEYPDGLVRTLCISENQQQDYKSFVSAHGDISDYIVMLLQANPSLYPSNEAVKYAEHIIYAASLYQHFIGSRETISPSCDVLQIPHP